MEVGEQDSDVFAGVLPVEVVACYHLLVEEGAEMLGPRRVILEDQLAKFVGGPHLLDDFFGVAVLALLHNFLEPVIHFRVAITEGVDGIDHVVDFKGRIKNFGEGHPVGPFNSVPVGLGR